MKRILLCLLFTYYLTIQPTAIALTFIIKDDSDIVGNIRYTYSKEGETLYDIARFFDLGTFEIMEANPQIDPKQIPAGTKVLLPTAFILPQEAKEGIVLNLAELRVYYFHQDQNLVSTHPIGVGRLGWRTPVGTTTIVRKREKPTWRPPASIRASAARKGKILPESVPPGPNNPLGDYAMNLGWPRYLMHGTNQPESVGLRSSSGCIRMYPEDIEHLFKIVPKGTTVKVIYEPFKIGKSDNKLYLEAHEPFPEPYYGEEDEEQMLEQVIHDITKTLRSKIDWQNAKKEIKHTFGYPIPIGVFH